MSWYVFAFEYRPKYRWLCGAAFGKHVRDRPIAFSAQEDDDDFHREMGIEIDPLPVAGPEPDGAMEEPHGALSQAEWLTLARDEPPPTAAAGLEQQPGRSSPWYLAGLATVRDTFGRPLHLSVGPATPEPVGAAEADDEATTSSEPAKQASQLKSLSGEYHLSVQGSRPSRLLSNPPQILRISPGSGHAHVPRGAQKGRKGEKGPGHRGLGLCQEKAVNHGQQSGARGRVSGGRTSQRREAAAVSASSFWWGATPAR